MKKYKMLGVNTNTEQCCILRSEMPFMSLSADNISSSDFEHIATNWNGSDSISRTLKIKNLKQTGNILKLKRKLSFSGNDSDMGVEYHWSFSIDEIHEIVSE